MDIGAFDSCSSESGCCVHTRVCRLALDLGLLLASLQRRPAASAPRVHLTPYIFCSKRTAVPCQPRPIDVRRGAIVIPMQHKEYGLPSVYVRLRRASRLWDILRDFEGRTPESCIGAAPPTVGIATLIWTSRVRTGLPCTSHEVQELKDRLRTSPREREHWQRKVSRGARAGPGSHQIVSERRGPR
ncbi:hypothetical protein PENSPDRAFT_257230 [Peniophora sp. CONT]|nr:hypothetical protein PENSPDRAFT_257230 [Peniophora sp. CONT]